MLSIREAEKNDFEFVVNLMISALSPYYGGDHRRHAERIFSTHISGGLDRLGFFSLEQRMFIASLDDKPVGMIHLVLKRQGTVKISPLIIHPDFQGRHGIGSRLLEYAEAFGRSRKARQLYCTVAEQNEKAYSFFIKHGFTVVGKSDSHYKIGITEKMMHKSLHDDHYELSFDKLHISVHPYSEQFADQVRALLLDRLPDTFQGIDSEWVNSLFQGYTRRDINDINAKYKLLFVAIDRKNQVHGVVGATPKKGSPIKLMPFIATDLPSFTALLKDVPYYLKPYGHKLYIHLSPTAEETGALLQQKWKLNAAMPSAYRTDTVTQQWSFDIGDRTMRSMRVKDRFLRYIESGDKDLEVRVAYPSINGIEVGEFVEFQSRTRSVIARIKDIRRYVDIHTMLEKEKAARIVPNMPSSELKALLQEIYPPDKERLGVIVFEINPVPHGDENGHK